MMQKLCLHHKYVESVYNCYTPGYLPARGITISLRLMPNPYNKYTAKISSTDWMNMVCDLLAPCTGRSLFTKATGESIQAGLRHCVVFGSLPTWQEKENASLDERDSQHIFF